MPKTSPATIKRRVRHLAWEGQVQTQIVRILEPASLLVGTDERTETAKGAPVTAASKRTRGERRADAERRVLSPEETRKAFGLSCGGTSAREIARRLSVSHQTVGRALKQMERALAWVDAEEKGLLAIEILEEGWDHLAEPDPELDEPEPDPIPAPPFVAAAEAAIASLVTEATHRDDVRDALWLRARGTTAAGIARTIGGRADEYEPLLARFDEEYARRSSR